MRIACTFENYLTRLPIGLSGRSDDLIKQIVHVINFTLEIAKRNITKWTIWRAHRKKLCGDLDCSHDSDAFVTGNFSRPLYTEHPLINVTHGSQQGFSFCRQAGQGIIAPQYGHVDAFHVVTPEERRAGALILNRSAPWPYRQPGAECVCRPGWQPGAA